MLVLSIFMQQNYKHIASNRSFSVHCHAGSLFTCYDEQTPKNVFNGWPMTKHTLPPHIPALLMTSDRLPDPKWQRSQPRFLGFDHNSSVKLLLVCFNFFFLLFSFHSIAIDTGPVVLVCLGCPLMQSCFFTFIQAESFSVMVRT